MTEVVKSDSLTACSLQYHLQPLPHMTGIDGLLRFESGGEHQRGEDILPVLRKDLHHVGWEDDRADCGVVLRELASDSGLRFKSPSSTALSSAMRHLLYHKAVILLYAWVEGNAFSLLTPPQILRPTRRKTVAISVT